MTTELEIGLFYVLAIAFVGAFYLLLKERAKYKRMRMKADKHRYEVGGDIGRQLLVVEIISTKVIYPYETYLNGGIQNSFLREDMCRDIMRQLLKDSMVTFEEQNESPHNFNSSEQDIKRITARVRVVKPK